MKKNQVIKNTNLETGKKIIKYWKEKGIDTKNYIGTITEENGATHIYYGLINDRFNNYPLQTVIEEHAEILTLEGELSFPRKMLVWQVEEEKAQLKTVLWINSNGDPKFPILCVLSEMEFEKGLPYNTIGYKYAKEAPEEVKEMTMEEICQMVGSKVKIVESH
jgi:hypothetical protein